MEPRGSNAVNRVVEPAVLVEPRTEVPPESRTMNKLIAALIASVFAVGAYAADAAAPKADAAPAATAPAKAKAKKAGHKHSKKAKAAAAAASK
jgi:hypothetical protein